MTVTGRKQITVARAMNKSDLGIGISYPKSFSFSTEDISRSTHRVFLDMLRKEIAQNCLERSDDSAILDIVAGDVLSLTRSFFVPGSLLYIRRFTNPRLTENIERISVSGGATKRVSLPWQQDVCLLLGRHGASVVCGNLCLPCLHHHQQRSHAEEC